MKTQKMMVALALAVAVTGCGHWQSVQYTTKPTAISDPAAEVKALLNSRQQPAVNIEVTDSYVKEIWIGSGVFTGMLLFSRVGSLKIITRDNIYQVSAYDKGGNEFWAFRPAGNDVETCEKMMDALYALMKLPAESTGAAEPR